MLLNINALIGHQGDISTMMFTNPANPKKCTSILHMTQGAEGLFVTLIAVKCYS